MSRDAPFIYNSPTAFFNTLFSPDDAVLVRHIETWFENGKKKSRVRGTWHCAAGKLVAGKTWAALGELAEAQRANQFFGVCPRFRDAEGYDLACQIRAVRSLWADIDDCSTEEAKRRCARAGLPEPAATVSSGNGAHLYWLLDEPYLIDDAEEPSPIFTRKEGGKVVYTLADGTVIPRPELSAKARHVQSVQQAIAGKIGGDHTHDLARLLRLPGTWNRKDVRNGNEPVPCSLVELDPTRRYTLAEFEKFGLTPAAVSRRSAPAPTPPPHRIGLTSLTQAQQERLGLLLAECASAPPGKRSERDFALCKHACACRLDPEEVWELAQAHQDQRRGLLPGCT